MKRKILVVDDEKKIVDIIMMNLKREGYEVICAYDGAQGLELCFKEEPELVLLDIMMPKMDGFEVCKRIREKLQTPIIMLTARAEEVDKVLGFELGADDYVTKPFGIRELLARVKASLRRVDMPSEKVEKSDKPEKTVETYGDITIDLGRVEIMRCGDVIDLTRREFELISFLAKNSGIVFTREELLERVWGYEYYGDVRTVDVTVRRLRTKIEADPEKPKYVLTKRSVGYYFGEAE